MGNGKSKYSLVNRHLERRIKETIPKDFVKGKERGWNSTVLFDWVDRAINYERKVPTAEDVKRTINNIIDMSFREQFEKASQQGYVGFLWFKAPKSITTTNKFFIQELFWYRCSKEDLPISFDIAKSCYLNFSEERVMVHIPLSVFSIHSTDFLEYWFSKSVNRGFVSPFYLYAYYSDPNVPDLTLISKSLEDALNSLKKSTERVSKGFSEAIFC